MSYQVLARKWRPRNFHQLVGQAHVVQALVNGLAQGRVHHAFLFTGTRGVGKTTIARILAKSLNCATGVTPEPCGECEHCVAIDEGRFVDLLEIDAASRTKVDDTREMLDNVQYAPARGRFKVYLIDEVHMLSTHSFNALLKTLEEPPDHVKFVLATTDPQKIPVTILSRCLQFNLRRLHVDEIGGQLGRILADEDIEFESGALDLLARAADGSMRDALSLMDQALASGAGGPLEASAVEDMLGTVEQRHLHQLLEALVEGDAAAAMATIDEVHGLARNLEALLAGLAETLHRIGLIQQVPDYRDDSRDDWERLVDFAGRMDPEDIQLYYQIAVTGRRDLALAPGERTGCQMTLLRMLAFRPAPAEAGPSGNVTGTEKPAATAVREEAPEHTAAPAGGPVDKPRQQAAAAGEPTPPANGNSALPEPADWPQLLPRLGLNPSVHAVASLMALESVHGERLVFRVAEDDRAMMTERFRTSLGQALEAHCARPVVVDIRYGEASGLATPAEESLAARDQAQDDAEAAIDSDPLVQRLRRQFNAEVVDGSVRPADRSDH